MQRQGQQEGCSLDGRSGQEYKQAGRGSACARHTTKSNSHAAHSCSRPRKAKPEQLHCPPAGWSTR